MAQARPHDGSRARRRSGGQPAALCSRRPRAGPRIPGLRRLPGRLSPLLFILFSAVLTSTALLAAGRLYEVREIKTNVYVWIPDDVLDQDGDPEFNRAGTSGFVITSKGVVVVDTTNSPFHARELLYEIRRRTDQPVKYVINTDSQGDYILGNEVFVEQRATIISTVAAQAEIRRYQQALARWMEEDWRAPARMRGFHVTLPHQTFQGEIAVSLDAQVLKLLAMDSGAKSGDAAVYLPAEKTLFLGGLFQNGYFPRIGLRDVRRWVETLRQLEAWEVETYVPGHGPPAGKKELADFRKFLESLIGAVESGIRQGKSLPQMKSELLPFENYPWRARELAAEAVEAVYGQVAGQPETRSGIK